MLSEKARENIVRILYAFYSLRLSLINIAYHYSMFPIINLSFPIIHRSRQSFNTQTCLDIISIVCSFSS